MKLGIKVSHQPESINDLKAVNPAMCEVWFDINQADKYEGLFNELKTRKLDVGLHFWGALADGTWTNLAYPDKELILNSMNLMRRTINIAGQNGFQYVNIHPGCAAKINIDITRGFHRLISNPVDFDIAGDLVIKNVSELASYARTKNVVLTVETVPIRAVNGWYAGVSRDDPRNVENIYELPVSAILEAAQNGLWVANDFCHTAANTIADKAQYVWQFLHDTTVTLAPQTRLIHLGFILPPYNGTDIHDELDNPMLDTNGAVPNKKQMIELLKIFKNKSDVWILVEPRKDHIKNYFLAKKILETADVSTV